MINWLERQAERYVVWCLARRARRDGHDVEHVRTFAQRALAQLPADITAMCVYQESEAAVLTKRLGRRYDPGLALNEATNRALDAKQAAVVTTLSATQLAALEVQKQTVRRIVERMPSKGDHSL